MKPLIALLLTTLAANAAVFTLPKAFPLPTASVTVAWDAMPGAVRYNVYLGDKSRAYTNWTATTATSMTIPVVRGSTNYIAVTQEQNNLESDFSTEVKYIAPAGPPPPTNVVQVGFVVEGSTNMLNWIKLATIPNVISLTNPPDAINTFRGYLTITEKQL